MMAGAVLFAPSRRTQEISAPMPRQYIRPSCSIPDCQRPHFGRGWGDGSSDCGALAAVRCHGSPGCYRHTSSYGHVRSALLAAPLAAVPVKLLRLNATGAPLS